MMAREVQLKCFYCGKFCGDGFRWQRNYSVDGTPVEDIVVCCRCEPSQDEIRSRGWTPQVRAAGPEKLPEGSCGNRTLPAEVNPDNVA